MAVNAVEKRLNAILDFIEQKAIFAKIANSFQFQE